MRKFLNILVMVAVVAGVLAGGYFEYQRLTARIAAEDVLPSGAVFFARMAHTEKNLDAFLKGSFWQNLQTVDVVKLMEDSGISAKRVEEYKTLRDNLTVAVNSPLVRKFFGQEVAVAVYPVDRIDFADPIKGLAPSVVLINRLSPEVRALEFFAGLNKEWGDDLDVASESYKQHILTKVTLKKENVEIWFTQVRDLMIAGIGPAAARNAVDVLTGARKALATDAKFVQIKARYVKNADAVVFLDITSLGVAIRDNLPAWVRRGATEPGQAPKRTPEEMMADASGFLAYGMSYLPGPSLHRMNILLAIDRAAMTPEYRRYYDCTPTADTAAHFVPAGAVGYQWGNCYDAPAMWERMKTQAAAQKNAKHPDFNEQVAAFEQRYGLSIEKDILPVLGHEAGGYSEGIKTKSIVPIPRLAVFIKVNDTAAADKIIRALINSPMVLVKTDTYGGTTINYVPLPFLSSFEPGYCFVDGYLLVATGRKLLQSSIDAAADPKKSLLADEEFKKLKLDSGPANSVFYLRVGETARQVRELLEWGQNWFSLKMAQVQAMTSAAELKTAAVAKELDEKQQDLQKTVEQLDQLKTGQGITKDQSPPPAPEPSASPAPDKPSDQSPSADEAKATKTPDEQMKDLKQQSTDLAKDIEILKSEQLESDKSVKMLKEQLKKSEQLKLFVQQALMPVLTALESIRSHGAVMHTDEHIVETQMTFQLQSTP